MTKRKNWNPKNEIYNIKREIKLNNISKDIFKTLQLEYKNILNLHIHQDILNALIEKKSTETEVNIISFFKNFEKIPSFAVDDITKKNINDLQKYIKNDVINKKLDFLLKDKNKIIDEYIDMQEYYDLLDNKVKILEKEQGELEKKLKNTNTKLIQTKKYNAFQGSIIGTEKKYIMGLQHQIRHSSSRILTNLELFLKENNRTELTNDEKSFLNVISMESSKILSIANFITKANYDLKTNDEINDIVNFIDKYIDEIYINDSKLIDTDLKVINVYTNDIEYICEYIPLEITTVIDNFITNAENAEVNNLVFSFKKNNDELLIEISDDGHGIVSEKINSIFEFGFTTTDGSGIGLYNIKTTIENMNGNISVKSNGTSSTTFLIRLKNEIKL